MWQSLYSKLEQRFKHEEYYPLYLVLLSVLSSVILYLPIYLQDPSNLFRYWDGPNYMYIARTLYDIPSTHPFVSYNLTPAYFACHLPLYPLLIRLFSYLMGYQAAMLAVTLISSGLASVLFYYLLKEMKIVRSPFWSAIIALFLPVRWIIYHSVGATEPLFLALIFASMLCWNKEKYRWAIVLCGLASVTRIVGLLALFGYFCLILHQKKWRNLTYLPLGLLPILAVFSFYAWRFGDFFAYFSWNSKLLNPNPLFSMMAFSSNNASSHAEAYAIQYLAYGMGTLLLWRFPLLFWYSASFCVFNLFIFHEDLGRYYLPVAPFALIVAYDQILSSKAARLMLPFICYTVYNYSWPLLRINIMMTDPWLALLQALK